MKGLFSTSQHNGRVSRLVFPAFFYLLLAATVFPGGFPIDFQNFGHGCGWMGGGKIHDGHRRQKN